MDRSILYLNLYSNVVFRPQLFPAPEEQVRLSAAAPVPRPQPNLRGQPAQPRRQGQQQKERVLGFSRQRWKQCRAAAAVAAAHTRL